MLLKMMKSNGILLGGGNTFEDCALFGYIFLAYESIHSTDMFQHE